MTAATGSAPAPMTGEQAADFQRLWAHLTNLKLPTAVEQLPEVLDTTRAENLSVTATLERLLAADVQATEERRLAGRLRFPSLPAPWTLEDLDFEASPARWWLTLPDDLTVAQAQAQTQAALDAFRARVGDGRVRKRDTHAHLDALALLEPLATGARTALSSAGARSATGGRLAAVGVGLRSGRTRVRRS